MSKFDIKKAAGRTPMPATGINKEDDSIDYKLNLFDTIVTHNYLAHLSECPILPIKDNSTGMGWYRITQIVLDRDKFFPDQLSMLYTALHDVAKNVALVIQKKDFDDIEIYLGARDFEGPLHESSTLLKSAIQGYLPGIKSEQAIDKHFLFDESKENYVASYSGVASLRDDKKKNLYKELKNL